MNTRPEEAELFSCGRTDRLSRGS